LKQITVKKEMPSFFLENSLKYLQISGVANGLISLSNMLLKEYEQHTVV